MPETNFVKFKSFISGFAKGEHCFGKYSDVNYSGLKAGACN